jgi:hypothetical protein
MQPRLTRRGNEMETVQVKRFNQEAIPGEERASR